MRPKSVWTRSRPPEPRASGFAIASRCSSAGIGGRRKRLAFGRVVLADARFGDHFADEFDDVVDFRAGFVHGRQKLLRLGLGQSSGAARPQDLRVGTRKLRIDPVPVQQRLHGMQHVERVDESGSFPGRIYGASRRDRSPASAT